MHFNRALRYLGTNINFMSLFVFEKIGLGEQRNTQVTLQLADKSSVPSKRVLEDVLVKVRNLLILVDFVVLNFKENWEIPILLGSPFLATSKSTIYLDKNELTMKINGEMKIFKCGHELIYQNST